MESVVLSKQIKFYTAILFSDTVLLLGVHEINRLLLKENQIFVKHYVLDDFAHQCKFGWIKTYHIPITFPLNFT